MNDIVWLHYFLGRGSEGDIDGLMRIRRYRRVSEGGLRGPSVPEIWSLSVGARRRRRAWCHCFRVVPIPVRTGGSQSPDVRHGDLSSCGLLPVVDLLQPIFRKAAFVCGRRCGRRSGAEDLHDLFRHPDGAVHLARQPGNVIIVIRFPAIFQNVPTLVSRFTPILISAFSQRSPDGTVGAALRRHGTLAPWMPSCGLIGCVIGTTDSRPRGGFSGLVRKFPGEVEIVFPAKTHRTGSPAYSTPR